MLNKETYPIEKNDDYLYNVLEVIRESGITNMWGAAPILAEATGVDMDRAEKVLLEFISNYSELSKRFGWQD